MTRVWRYRAAALTGDHEAVGGATLQVGELAAPDPASARAALRGAGLTPLDLQPVSSRHGVTAQWSFSLPAAFVDRLNASKRRRRSSERASFYDGMATLLECGAPLVEAIDSVLESRQGRHGRAWRGTLASIRESVREGAGLGAAMREQSGFFDVVDAAMIEAAEQSGSLIEVMRSLASREERADQVRSRLVGALAYPALVLVAAVGVTLFLSARTLPELAGVLENAGIETPALTRRVMAFGQWVIGAWPWLIGGATGGWVALLGLTAWGRRRGYAAPAILTPAFRRRRALGELALRLSQLLRSGAPLVEAMRIAAPTAGSRSLEAAIRDACKRIEGGDELDRAFAQRSDWFDAEFTQIVALGKDAGELDTTLERYGEQALRDAIRFVDRFTMWLEPVAIIALAGLVGLVALAGALPIVRLQEVL